MSMMMVQVDVMCCKSVGTDLSMLDIDDLMTEICQLKKEVKLLETKLRERDQLNRKDVCGVSLCDFTDQTSPDLLLSVCNEEQKTSVKLLDCEMELKTEITEAEVQIEKGVLIYSGLIESKTEITESGQHTEKTDLIYSDLKEAKEERSEPNEIEEENNFTTREDSPSCLWTEESFPQKTSHTCPQCGKIFTYISKRDMHMRIHTIERRYRCDHCENFFKFKSKLILHMRIHTGKRPYGCDQCGSTFAREYHLHRHTKIHTGEKSYKCDLCERSFIRKDHLNVHMRVHTDEKPHRCDQCGKSFASASTLRDHLLYHSGVRSFQCEQCSKAFITAMDLKRHMKTHTGVKPHVCSICGKAFLHLSKLKDHKNTKTHTGVGSHMCSEQKCHPCSSSGQGFRKSRNLEIHMKKCCKVHPHETVQTRRTLRSSAVTCQTKQTSQVISTR